MQINYKSVSLLAILLFPCLTQGQTLDLSGDWRLRLDPEDAGVRDGWYQQPLPDAVRLPGSLQEQGYGAVPTLETDWTGSIREEILQLPRYAPYRSADSFKMPFWLQPKRAYVGPAWYGREVSIPTDWAGRRIALRLERCHWFTSVWVDGRNAGDGESLCVPHVFDVTDFLSPGQHQIAIRVDNRLHINVGNNSHSVTDHTQTNWNGVVGKIELVAGSPVWIDDVQVYHDAAGRQARVEVVVSSPADRPVDATLTVQASCGDHQPKAVSQSVRITGPRQQFTIDLPLGEGVRRWDEHEPNLYDLCVTLDGDASDRRQVTFGVRQLATQGSQFLLNGQPVFFRGTLECCIFPRTGYPPTDVDSWEHIIRTCKQFGLNHIRFHSWCPPEAAFIAADQLGFYFQVECASWANGGASVGDGKPLDAWLYREADRILQAYGNHPSFVLLAYGNEPAGPGNRGSDYLGPWVDHYRAKATRQLVTCAAGWPYIPENQFHVMHHPLRQHGVYNRRAPETTADYGQQVQKYAVPLISHETGQWCVFPNLEEIDKYTGVLQAKNFEIVRDFLEAHGLLHQARDFLLNSGWFQTLLYKEEVEVMLRTPGFGGFQLLDLHDFPGQGTALIGVLDPFWDAKPYVDARHFRSFCGPVVPLARLPSHVWTSDQTLSAIIEVSQFGAEHLPGATVDWTLCDEDGQFIGQGQWADVDLQRGSLCKVGRMECPLSAIERAAKLTLRVSVAETPYVNQWEIWVYPPQVDTEPADDVLVARTLGGQAETHLRAGGKVMLLAPPAAVGGDTHGSFEPIFWNRLWFPTQQVHTLGLLCDPQHPALARFPTDSHSNWQWWDLCNRSKPMVMDDLPRDLFPVVQVIDDWNTCRKLGLVFEARTSGGKLLVCAIDLTTDLDRRPVARQLRHSLLAYMTSKQFAPQIEINAQQIRGLFRPLTALQKLGATICSSSQQSGYEAQNAIDGDPNTIWHTDWNDSQSSHPHEIIIDLKAPQTIRGLSCLPRQDMTNGRIADYAIHVSSDGNDWGQPVVQGRWNDGVQQRTARFAQAATARFVKLIALSEVHGQRYASAAEIDLLID